MSTRPGRRFASRVETFLPAVALALSACANEATIELVPIFPNDEPRLLEAAEVDELTVVAEPVDAGDEAVARSVELSVGEKLRMRLPVGTWRIEVTGTSASREVVHGETAPFEVARGDGDEVRFFLGRSMAFNEVRLEPVDLASELGDLVGAFAIAYEEADGRPMVLIAGGRGGAGGAPLSDAYVVDPAEFTIEKIASMSCPRAGHGGFVLDDDTDEAGALVVMSGGDAGGCLGDLEVFDTSSRSFARIDACGLDSTDGAVPQLSDSGTATAAQDGWVIVPGNPRCKVNPYTGEAISGPTLAEPAPGAPLQAAINPSGRMLVATQYQLFVDTFDQADTAGLDQCVEGDAWAPEAVWSGIEGRADAVMHPLEDERFVYIGGRLPGVEDTDPRYGWSVVTAGECRISTILEGELAPAQPRTGFALLDLGLHDGGDVGLLAAGGRDDETSAALDKVYLLSQVQGASAPTVHDLSVQSRSFTIGMKRPRAGHVAARMSNGDYWIFGGGASVPEIFVRGKTELETFHDVLEKRSPTLASVSVLDTLGAAPGPGEMAPINQLFADKYVDLIYSQWTEFTNMLFFVASADLGVGDGLLDDSPLGAQGCEEDKPLNIKGTASGDVSGIDVPDVETFPISDPSAFNIEDVKAGVRSAIADIDGSGDDCGWRQLFAAGLAGLDKAAEVSVPTLPDPSLGVNVLFFVTAGDDCSQGVFDDLDVEPVDPPPASVLAAEYCSSDAYDEYFGLPPESQEHLDAFAKLVLDLSWDPEDLIVVLFGATEPASCDAGELGPLVRADRLVGTMAAMGDLRVETVLIDLCEANTVEALADPMKDLLARIKGRNPHQACLPRGIIDEEPEFDAARGQYVPVESDKARAEDVARVCRLVYVEEEAPQIGQPTHRIAVEIDSSVAADPDIATVATDSDGRAQCPVTKTQWLLRIDMDVLEEEIGATADVQALDFVCLP